MSYTSNDELLAKRARARREIAAGRLVIEAPGLREDLKPVPSKLHLPAIEHLEALGNVVEDDPSICAKCSGRGWTAGPPPATVRRCGCQRHIWTGPSEVPAAELEARGVDRKVSGQLREDWNPKWEAWPREADDWPQGMRVNRGLTSPGELPSWLYLWGEPGAGKSAVAAWIMRRAIARGTACRWIPVRETIRQTYDLMTSAAGAPVWSWLRYPLVVLEDVKQIRADLGSHIDVLWQMVDARHTLRGGYTVVTSNWSPGELGRHVDSAIASRVLSGHDREMTGKDGRRRRWKFSLRDAIEKGRNR